MTQMPAPSASAEEADLVAAELIEELATRLQAGETPDLEACAREHPECAERIRRLLPAVQVLADLGRAPAAQTDSGAPGPRLRVLGDFRLRREVGRGGMGVVYEAEQISLRRRVALKVLPFAAMLDPRQLQRFHNEARAAACLQHPSIVPVHAVGCDRNVHYYAMQFIEGQTLAAFIHGLREQAGLEERRNARPTTARDTGPTGRSGLPPTVARPEQPTTSYPPPPDQPTSAADTAVSPTPPSTGRGTRAPSFFRRVAQLGVQAAEALEHAHQQGVVHRDVKPANILLDARGNLWIADFGLAQFQAEAGLTASGDLLGTLRYMSPEHAKGGRRVYDHRVDVYSLGVTLYELLTLERAFPGEDRMELLHQIITEDPRPARRVDQAVPADLETIVGKAMAKNPDERYATAQELAADLKRFLEDRPIRARRPSLWQQGLKMARRNQPYVWSLGLSAVLAVLLSVVGLGFFGFMESVFAKQEKESRERLELQHFDALLGRAESYRLDRKPGYRKQVWADLRTAEHMHMPADGRDRIRDRVLACLGDPIGLEPVTGPKAERLVRPEVPAELGTLLDKYGAANSPRAASADGRRLAFVAPGQAVPTLGILIDRQVKSYYTCPLGKTFEVLVGDRIGGGWPSPLGAIFDLEIGPDTRTVVAACAEGIAVWEIQPDNIPNLREIPLLLRSQSRVGTITSVAVHPEGRLVATAGRSLDLWSLDSNQRIASLEKPNATTKVAFSKDGKLLLAVGDGGVICGWPVTETPEKLHLMARQGGAPVVAFSPDGSRLASGSKDGTARICDVASGRVLRACHGKHFGSAPSADFPQSIEAVAFSPDGKCLATGDNLGWVSAWNAETGKEVAELADDGKTPPGGVWRLQFSPSGQYLAAAGNNGVAVWKVRPNATGVTLERVGTAIPSEAAHLVYDLAIHPTEKELVFLSAGRKVYAAKMEGSGEPRVLEKTSGVDLRGLNFDAAGDRLTFITNRGTLAVWDWRAHTAKDTNVPTHHVGLTGGRWAATSSPKREVVIYDLKTSRIAMTLPPEESEIWCLAWSPDGKRLAVSMSDGGVAIWDLDQVRQRLAEFGVTVPSTH